MANAMRLPSDIAGVTLFAFATGAPDIFTQLAAINEGQHVDIQLAVSSTLGSGLFIICIILAIVLLCTPSTIVLNDITNYVRDAAAYFFACLLVLIVMWDDALQVYEAMLLLACYVGYIACCLVTMRSSPAGYAPPTESQEGSPACVQLTAIATGCPVVVTKAPKADAGHLRYPTLSSTCVAVFVVNELVDMVYCRQHPEDNIILRRGPRLSCDEPPGSMLTSPRDDLSSPSQRSTQLDALARKPSKPAMHLTTPEKPIPTTPWQHVLALLHWHHTPMWLRPLAAFCAPLTLAMHATMPTVAPGS